MGDFFEILDLCIHRKLFSNRVKNFIENNKISNLHQLDEFINNPEDVFKQKNFGVKTIDDLIIFKSYLVDETKTLSLDIIYDSNPFINKIHNFCDKHNLNARALNFIKKNKIKDLNALNDLIENTLRFESEETIGIKTINDLRFIQYNMNASESGAGEQYSNLREKFFDKLGFIVNDLEILKSASNKNLDLGLFINQYFDDFFSDLAKSPRSRLKVLFSIILEDDEVSKYNQYTKERIRQINKVLEGVQLNQFKEKISFLIEYTSIDYELKTYIAFFNEFNFTSYVPIHKFILCVCNIEKFIIFNFDTRERETLKTINSNSNIVFISSIITSSHEFDSLDVKLNNLQKAKNFDSINIDELFVNFDRYNIDFLKLLKYFILANDFLSLEISDNKKIQNKNKQSPISLITTFLEKFSSPQSIKDILMYSRTKPGYEDVSQEYIRYIIQKNSDVFYNIGKTGFYGLKVSNDQKVISIKDECIKYLRNNPGPAHKSELVQNFRTKNIKSNARSIEEILRMYDSFKSIGQSFFILTEDNNNYERPIHCKSILTKIGNFYNLHKNWAKVSDVYTLIDSVKMPKYQNNAYKHHYFFIHNNLITEHIEFSNYANFIIVLNDKELGDLVFKSIKNFTDYNELDLKIITDNYIKENHKFTLNKFELLSTIKYHIKIKQIYGV